MKRSLIACIALLPALLSNLLLAQNIRWNSAPKTGFVFQISNNEAQKLLTKSGPDTIINSLLHTQIDTFNVSKGWNNRPAKGHFIMVKIVQNKLHCEYTSVFPYQVLLLKAYNGLSLQVLDLDGNVRNDARVKAKNRRIRFDAETNTYRVENEWFNASNKIVTVELDGFRSIFNIEKHEAPSWSNDYYNYDEGPDFYSYMITDKNKYKPGEKIRFKSYALSGSRTPLHKDLDIWLMKPGKPLKLGKVSPHRPGSFAGEIQLTDSLKLILDQYYTLQLWEKSGRVVANCSFKYEDYELHGNKLDVNLETSTHFYPSSNYIKIRATSENGLILKDARAFITVLTENIKEIFQPLVVLPDTLLFKQVQLNTEGETVVEIPSSLFQKSNSSYYVNVAVLNSENQRMEKSVAATHFYSSFAITASYSNDSILFQALDKALPMQNFPVTVYRDGATEGIEMILPHKEKINPAISTIKFTSELVSRSIRMDDMLPKIEFVGGVEKDSFKISIDNPQKIQASWYLYQGSTLLEKGFSDDINFKSKIEDRSQTYYAELLYSFGGFDHIISKEFEFRDGSLDIALRIPDRVYPGQKVDALIEVTDDEGNAVGGVDLTAMATTAKLNYYPPTLPYYGNTSSARSDKATYSKNEVNKRYAVLDLDYSTWVTRARLDTMKYYQFTYPGRNFFYHQVDIDDSTQFVAYVMRNGEAKKIYVIEVNRLPVYYSWTDHPQGYSFYITPNRRKQVTLRLYDRVLILDSLCFDPGKKTIFSVDLDHLPKSVIVHNMAPEIVKTGKKRSYRRWAFTFVEANRHTSYVAAFTLKSNPSYLIAGDQFVALSAGRSNGGKVIAGPILPGMQTYIEHDKVSTRYKHIGGFTYDFEDNIVYKTDAVHLIPDKLSDVGFNAMLSINDVVINKKLLLAREPYSPEKWHPRVIDLVDNTSRVKVFLPFEQAQSGVASLLFQDCKTKLVASPCKMYSSGSDYFTIARGCHHLILLYNNGSYMKMERVNFKSYTNVVADMKDERLHPADSMSRAWLYTLSSNCYHPVSTPTRTFSFRSQHNAIGNVHGIVFDDSNNVLTGATIVVTGTTIGTVTDADGRFILDIPQDPSTLAISFIGYVSKTVEVRPGSEITIVMESDISQLQEVVVTGYGEATTRESLTASVVSSLSGRVAGVSISETETVEARTPQAEKKYSKVETREAERKLYTELLTLKSLRSQFSDVGFWEPRLFTDRHGQSSFTVTFPDDITRWDAVVYAMNRQLKTGTLRKSIKSYKPLMTQLAVPQFLTVGDSSDFTGKVLNYTTDKTIQGKTKWISSASTLENPVTFDSYHAEKLPVAVTSSDTIKASYSFTRDDGYFDGEERKIPVVQQGTIRANGTLSMMKNNDVLRVQSKNGEVVTVNIFNSQLDVYADDIRYLVHYAYDCNEQLASKLIGFVNYKLLMQYEEKPFKYDKDVKNIIERLLKNQNAEFLWSWWDVSPNTSYWMSAHILRALKAAKDAGYVVNLDLENITRKATYKYEFLKQVSLSDVQIIHALAIWNAQIDYPRFVKMMERGIRSIDSVALRNKKRYGYQMYSTFNEKLLLLEVRQLQKLPFVQDSLLHYKKETILKEIYFSDGGPVRAWHSADLSSNAVAYRIINRDSTLKEMSTAMQMYFLSLRKKGGWNTYDASNVLMSILPDLIAQGVTKKAPAMVSLKGKVNEQIQKFPYKIQLTGGEGLEVRKETGLPLFCMQYKEERVITAQAGTDAFKIKTSFDKKTMKAGTPAILKVTVEVKRDTDLEHVMIEIPIPGGCSYADKRQFDNSIETHREYFKERTVIFCEGMKTGTYVFQVQLLPRFTGKYHVNPTQVSLMYFPVINANTDMEKVRIEE
jgi:hypothetical protein